MVWGSGSVDSLNRLLEGWNDGGWIWVYTTGLNWTESNWYTRKWEERVLGPEREEETTPNDYEEEKKRRKKERAVCYFNNVYMLDCGSFCFSVLFLSGSMLLWTCYVSSCSLSRDLLCLLSPDRRRKGNGQWLAGRGYGGDGMEGRTRGWKGGWIVIRSGRNRIARIINGIIVAIFFFPSPVLPA